MISYKKRKRVIHSTKIGKLPELSRFRLLPLDLVMHFPDKIRKLVHM